MSRVGKQPIEIASGVTVKLEGNKVVVKGSKGSLSLVVPEVLKIEQTPNQLTVGNLKPDNIQARSSWGTYRRLIANMVKGVAEGFVKELEINGVGFKVEVKGKKLVLNVGFSHPVEFNFPDGVEITIEKNIIKVSGIDKQLVGEIAARIRKIKKPEPYKGKGIKYLDEVIRRKAGKQAKSASA